VFMHMFLALYMHAFTYLKHGMYAYPSISTFIACMHRCMYVSCIVFVNLPPTENKCADII
jgi:hypothetical protein